MWPNLCHLAGKREKPLSELPDAFSRRIIVCEKEDGFPTTSLFRRDGGNNFPAQYYFEKNIFSSSRIRGITLVNNDPADPLLNSVEFLNVVNSEQKITKRKQLTRGRGVDGTAHTHTHTHTHTSFPSPPPPHLLGGAFLDGGRL